MATLVGVILLVLGFVGAVVTIRFWLGLSYVQNSLLLSTKIVYTLIVLSLIWAGVALISHASMAPLAGVVLLVPGLFFAAGALRRWIDRLPYEAGGVSLPIKFVYAFIALCLIWAGVGLLMQGENWSP